MRISVSLNKVKDRISYLKLKGTTKRLDSTTVTFAVLSLLFGIYFACVVPIGYGNDEGSHALKAGAISIGNGFSSQITTRDIGNGQTVTIYGSATPDALVNLEYAAGYVRGMVACPTTYTCPKPSMESASKIEHMSAVALDGKDHTVVDLMGANMYNPIAYLGAVLAMNIGSVLSLPVGSVIIMARVVTLLLYVALCSIALFILRGSKAKWIIFCAALMPGSLIAAASIGIDSALNGFIFLIFALFIRSFTEGKLSIRLRILLIVSSLIIPLIKLPYAVVSIAAILLPIYKRGVLGWIMRILILSITLLPALIWMRVSSEASKTQSFYVHAGTSPPDLHSQLIFILSHPLEYMLSLIKSPVAMDWMDGIGSLTHQTNVQLPSLLLFLGIVVVMMASIITKQSSITHQHNKRAFYTIIAGVPLLSILGIATALYLAFNPVGSEMIHGVQGRYFLPLIPFIALSLSALMPLKIHLQVRPLVFYTGANILILVATSLWYFIVIY